MIRRSCRKQTGWWKWGAVPGADGGTVIAEGHDTVTLRKNPESPSSGRICPVQRHARKPDRSTKPDFSDGVIHMETGFDPYGKAADSGYSQAPADRDHRSIRFRKDNAGAGKPGSRAGGSSVTDKRMPEHIRKIEAEGIHQVKLIDATPIGVNVRSTVATYANVHDELRKDLRQNGGSKAAGLQGR